MQNQDFLDPPIEVIASSPRLEMIKSRLKSAGLRPYTAREKLHDSDPLLIDAASASAEQLHAVRKQIARQVERAMVFLAHQNAPALKDTIMLTRDQELSTVPLRLRAYQRKSDRVSEGLLRLKTAEAIAGRQIRVAKDQPANVLFIGDGSSRFLALKAALGRFDISVTAALTALTARNYLDDEHFSAVIVDFEDASASALEFLRSFSDDYVRSCVPVFAITGQQADYTIEESAALSNATEIIDASLPLMQTAETIANLAEYHESITPIVPGTLQDHRIHDKITGLFTSGFLHQHLAHQIEALSDTLQPLSFITLQLTSAHDGNATARKALPEFAQQIVSRMRQTDCAGRLDWSTIGISLRGTSYAGGIALARRLIADLGGQVAGGSSLPLPSGVALSWRIIEKRRYHSAQDLIQSGLTGPKTRILSAA